MSLGMIIRDSCMFGPVVEVRRQIRCVLGVPEIHFVDEVTNRGNTRCAHHWLYQVILGYPLLDRGARFVYRGRKTGSWNVNDDGKPLTRAPKSKTSSASPILWKVTPARADGSSSSTPRPTPAAVVTLV